MKKLHQNGFPRPKIFLNIALIIVLSLAGCYVWYSYNHSRSKPNTVSECSSPAKPVQVDASAMAEAKAAFIAKGFTESWLNQHFQLISSETHTNVLTDTSTKREPENQVVTVLLYQMCVGDYRVTVSYDHSDDANSRSFAEIYAPVHDIDSVITLKEAQNDLTKCGGKLSGALANSISFTDIDGSGALYPKQTRLYLIGSISGMGGDSSFKGQRGGIIKSSQANIDLETGKCFVTTTAIGA